MALIVDIEKRLGAFTLRVAFQSNGGTLALLGASGCGKSMTLKCIAGVEKPDCGHIELDGVTLYDSARGIDLPPQKRRVGLLFQNYALFPNMTVRQNILAGMHALRDRAQRTEKLRQMLDMFDLAAHENHYPAQLSGGQQQRAALGRMLASEPELLLLDEPFSALDSHLRFRLEREMQQVIRRVGKPVVLVSHDRDEVFRLADDIVIIDHGRVEAAGPRHAIFRNPQTVAGARLTGCKFLSRAEVRGERELYAADWDLTLALDRDAAGCTAVGMRMHSVRRGEGENTVRCAVAGVIENPFDYTILLRPVASPEAEPFGWTAEKDEWHALGDPAEVTVHMPMESLLLLRGEADDCGNGI